MGVSKKNITNYKSLLTGGLKKNGFISWRYVFNATEKLSGTEKTFFIELEMLNPYLSPSEAVLGFTSRSTINPDDLQYALAGTTSATEMVLEKFVQPSYVAVRFGALGKHAKQICNYEAIQNTKINPHQFSVQVENCTFTEKHLSGFVNHTKSEIFSHPEYLCQDGYAEWNLDFEIIQEFEKGFSNKTNTWIPIGLRANFSGTINYCGEDYNVNPLKSFGYIDKTWGKTLPNPYFHIAASSLSSQISGRTLFDSSFVVHGLYDDRASVLLNFEGNKLSFCADENKRSYSCLWDCQQFLQNDEDQLHWSLSATNKTWVVDIDVFCNISELYNKVVELPEGNRKTLSMLTSGSGNGEIKLYKRIKDDLEQIENIRIAKAFCEFGKFEEPEV